MCHAGVVSDFPSQGPLVSQQSNVRSAGSGTASEVFALHHFTPPDHKGNIVACVAPTRVPTNTTTATMTTTTTYQDNDNVEVSLRQINRVKLSELDFPEGLVSSDGGRPEAFELYNDGKEYSKRIVEFEDELDDPIDESCRGVISFQGKHTSKQPSKKPTPKASATSLYEPKAASIAGTQHRQASKQAKRSGAKRSQSQHPTDPQ